ncbi:hypothetical protein [Thioalkalivibrio sp. ALgr3]|uniref:hypothetical protein n=1 Tax=Thioalkalivibrio sp. ALgr3 TaxID=1239292 RepID=UPI00036497AD|nr:hypothetical protein [Thioalkalivibrio sp. ALgr3]
MRGSGPDGRFRPVAGQRGSLLGLALVMLLVAVVVATGVAALVAGGTVTGADRVLGEKALFAAESGILRIQDPNLDCDDGPFDVGDSAHWDCTEPSDDVCGDSSRYLIQGWTGAGDWADAPAAHELCADPFGGPGIGAPNGDELASNQNLGNGGVLENGTIEDPDSATVSGTGQSHQVSSLTVDVGGAVDVALGNNSTLSDTWIEAGGSVSVSLGGQGSKIENVVIDAGGAVDVFVGNNSDVSCLVIMADGPVSVTGQGTTSIVEGEDYFRSIEAASASGCQGLGEGQNWSYAGS